MKTELLRRVRPNAQLPHDYAVQFGEKKRDNTTKAYPFFYNFIRYPYQIGTPDDSFGSTQATGIYRVSAADAEGPDGLNIVPGGILDIPVVMDNDTNFHLLYTKFGAFRVSQFTLTTTDVGDTFSQPTTDPFIDGQTLVIDTLTTTTGPVVGQVYFVKAAGATTFQISLTNGGAAITLTTNGSAVVRRQGGIYGSREYLLFPFTNSNPAAPGQALALETDRNARIPYWTELDVSLYLPSSGSRDVYGGFQREPIGGVTQEAPIPILDLQGSQDGVGMLKTPYQLTKSATVLIRVRSRCAYPLRVYGHLFGYKITL